MSIAAIPDSEFRDRQRAAAARAKQDGFDALLVWSRGGSTVDAYGDVYYLTNFHSLFPVVPDWATWASRGHAALVLPVDGEPTLLTDYLDDPEDRIKVTDVRSAIDIPTATIALLSEVGLVDRRIGLVGVNAMLLSAERRMRNAPGGENLELIPADYILEDLRVIKSAAELDMMRRAAAAGVEWMNATMGALVEGATEAEAVAEGLREFVSRGGVQQDVAIAAGPHASHYFGRSGIPHWNNTRKLQRGDLVHVDQWGPVDGYFTDFARSTVIGGKATEAQKEVLEGAVHVIDHLIEGVAIGATLGDLYERGARWMEANGFAGPQGDGPVAGSGSNFSNQFPSFGHNLGLGDDVPCVTEGETTTIRPNMVLALEVFVERPGVGGANFEQNVVVHEDGVEVLTEGCKKRWWS